MKRPWLFLVCALGCSAPTLEIETLSQALGAGFASADIGTVGVAGSASELGGKYTVKGAGADIWLSADGFRFVYKSLAGDGTISARIVSLDNTHASAKAGVMMRESSAAGSRNVMALLTPTSTNSYRFQTRATTNGTTTRPTTTGSARPPGWVRLVRAGNVFTAYSSADGKAWAVIGAPSTVAMGATLLVGLAVTSHTTSKVAAAVFSDVAVTQPVPPPPPDAGPVDAGVAEVGPEVKPELQPEVAPPTTPVATVSQPELVFSAIRATRSVVRTLTVRNTGGQRLDVGKPALAGSNKASFAFDGTAPNAFTLAPGAEATIRVVFVPTSTATLGTHAATLQLTSNDPARASIAIGLWGLATKGSEGANEPPLKQVIDTLGYAINVGGTALVLGTGTAPIGDEVVAPRFRRASPGPITMRPVARYSPDERLPFGLYTVPATTPVTQALGAINLGQFQTLLPTVEPGTIASIDPGEASFGLFTTTKAHSTFTEDRYNTGTVKHAVRSYPLRDRAGRLVPNAYLVGFEEASNGDYQDFVFVLENVVPTAP